MCAIKCVGNRFDRIDLAPCSDSKQKRVAIVFSYHFFGTKRAKMAVKTLWAVIVETLYFQKPGQGFGKYRYTT